MRSRHVRLSFAVSALALVLVGFAIACVLGGTHGKSEESRSDAAQQMKPRTLESRTLERKSDVDDSREIVCWGDSLTEGMGASAAIIRTDSIEYDASYKSYPEILNDLCGLSVFNCGISGATSEEIVAMREDVSLDDEGFSYLVFDPTVTEIGREHTGDILVIEIGSNGGWDGDYDKLIDQYWRIINYSDCDDYIVVGDTDDPGTSMGDEKQQAFEEGSADRETDWERALSAEFGEHFINMRLFLLQRGLGICGLEEGPDDEYLRSIGCISRRLRSDWTHLNSFGYFAKAYGIYERGVALGYWGENET